MEALDIDIHNEVYLVPWKEEWAHAFYMEKQCIISSMTAIKRLRHSLAATWTDCPAGTAMSV